jgi:hypothetical protein
MATLSLTLDAFRINRNTFASYSPQDESENKEVVEINKYMPNEQQSQKDLDIAHAAYYKLKPPLGHRLRLSANAPPFVVCPGIFHSSK